MYDNKHECARGRCERIADKHSVICKQCEEYIKDVGPIKIKD